MTLLLISFIGGVLTVLSPCVLPLLPIIVGGTLAGGTSNRRAITVTASLGVSVFIFTLLLKVSTAFIAVPPFVWNWLSGVIVCAVGIFFLFPSLWDRLPGTARANSSSNKLLSKGFMRQSFWGDVLVGASLGPVFSTCSPTYFIVLATILPVSLAQGTLDIFLYIVGLCASLLCISLIGQQTVARLGIAADSYGWFKRGVGVLFIAISMLLLTNQLSSVEAPLYAVFDETKVEQYILAHFMSSAQSVRSLVTSAPMDQRANMPYLTPTQKSLRYTQAPELVSPDAYINTDGKKVSLAAYKGKNVVLLDFWTYSCINCQRTLPYVTAWYQKYKDQGLVVLGVHTPEFAFEHAEENVTKALSQLGITYPVVLDNEYQTWNAYHNQYWPHEYVIDIDGFIVHDHSGEGEYDATEKAIQDALAERAARLGVEANVATNTVQAVPVDFSGIRSPETYFGANRNQYLANGSAGAPGVQTFTLPKIITPNALYLGGVWNIESEYAVNNEKKASMAYTYFSKNLYIVAAGIPTGSSVEVYQDGLLLPDTIAGKDVVAGVVTITNSRLYHLVANPEAGAHTITLIIKEPGLEAYTFTFG